VAADDIHPQLQEEARAASGKERVCGHYGVSGHDSWTFQPRVKVRV